MQMGLGTVEVVMVCVGSSAADLTGDWLNNLSGQDCRAMELSSAGPWLMVVTSE